MSKEVCVCVCEQPTTSYLDPYTKAKVKCSPSNIITT